MKIKTSELTGAALDWAVAQCLVSSEGYRDRGLLVHRIGYGQKMPDFSTNWEQGGPILERERLNLRASGAGDWVASTHDLAHPERRIQYGPTPLIAAMRCFISSRLGDEVEIPEELAC